MLHDVKTVPEMLRGRQVFVCSCSCGWSGPVREGRTSARIDGKRHKLAELLNDEI